MKHLTALLLVLCLVCSCSLADNKKVVPRALRQAGETDAISATNPTTVSASAIYTEQIRLVPSEYQSVALTLTSTTTIDATIEVEVSSGLDATPHWQPAATAQTIAITGSYDKCVALTNIPVSVLCRIKFGAEATDIPYTVTRVHFMTY